MKKTIQKLLLTLLLPISFTTASNAQCTVVSTNGYVVQVTIVPKTVVVSSTDCPNGYNYNLTYSYNVTFTGVNIPSSLYTLQTLISCNGQINGGYTMPLSGGSGISTTTTNPYIPNSGAAYNYVGHPDCGHATVQTLNCNNISVIIQGPGINYQTVNCNYSGNPLPVELVDYQGEITPKGVELKWATASEMNNNYFTITRSNNGSDWTELTQVKGSGTTSSYNAYSYTDESPVNGVNYYKLTQTDENGHSKDQGIASIEYFSENSSLTSVFPNPATGGNCTVRILSSSDEVLNIIVKDELGRIVSTRDITQLEKSGSRYITQEQIELPAQKQLYFVEILQNGVSIGRHKVITL